MGYDVFISYAHQDKAIADAACAKLESQGIRCWIAPRDIAPSADWATSIVAAIENCHVAVLIFSAHANESKQVHREVQRAFEREKPVVPFRIANVPPENALAYYMPSVHWLDALTPPLEQHLEELGASVQNLLSATSGRAIQEDRVRHQWQQRGGQQEDKQLEVRPPATRKVLVFLSEGGTCRDPMAKAIAAKLFEEHSRAPPVIRALGLGRPHQSGASFGARTAIQEMYGEDLLADHRPEMLSEEIARQAHLILAMEERQLEPGKTRPKGWPHAYPGTVYTFKTFFRLKDDIADPWPDGKDQTTLSRYRDCAKRLRQILSRNFDQLIQALDLSLDTTLGQ